MARRLSAMTLLQWLAKFERADVRLDGLDSDYGLHDLVVLVEWRGRHYGARRSFNPAYPGTVEHAVRSLAWGLREAMQRDGVPWSE